MPDIFSISISMLNMPIKLPRSFPVLLPNATPHSPPRASQPTTTTGPFSGCILPVRFYRFCLLVEKRQHWWCKFVDVQRDKTDTLAWLIELMSDRVDAQSWGYDVRHFSVWENCPEESEQIHWHSSIVRIYELLENLNIWRPSDDNLTTLI